MSSAKLLYPVQAGIVICLFVFMACRNKPGKNDVIVSAPAEMKKKAAPLIHDFIKEAIAGNGNPADSALRLNQAALANFLYRNNAFAPFWSSNEKWFPSADSLCQFIESSRLYGLFPEDYHIKEIQAIRERFDNDSLATGDRKNASLWSRADIMLTDAFVQVIRDIKLGRLPNDSVTLSKDTVLANEFYQQQLNLLQRSDSLSGIINSLEPRQRGYELLKEGIGKFLDSASFLEFTHVPLPGRDSLNFRKTLQKRLFEGGYIAFDSVTADSSQLARAVKKFQKEKRITVDGRAGEGTVRMLNLTDREKFIRIAINMDRYKKLPPKMPSRYVWVNVSSNYLDVIENDTVKFSSKVICGKPKTRTPFLTSGISALITYPQWVPPASIIAKEILPAVKKNPGYLARKGFSLVDSKGEEVDPYSVDWSKYNKTMPYKVVQGSGDENALGILKFHFDNKYSVYLHDTNQRYLFANEMRSLSHGCVRVQAWEQLAYYILHNDSLHATGRYTLIDSVKTWLKNKEKHSVAIKTRLPVFIRYFTCEGRNGEIVFYDDVYGDDQRLKEKYFASK